MVTVEHSEGASQLAPGELAFKATGVKKHYPGVKALDGVDLEGYAGEVLAVCGANGASPRSSSPGSTARWTGGWTRSARRWPRRCGGGRLSPTRAWPMSISRRYWPRRAGKPWRPPTPGRSGRCGASTGVKDPAYDPTQYVVDLVAPHTVNTMPEPTLHATADKGVIRGDTVRGSYDEAPQVLEDLRAVGVDYDEVVAALERDGVEKFQASWTELLESVSTAMAERR
jgi:hypothetical protein